VRSRRGAVGPIPLSSRSSERRCLLPAAEMGGRERRGRGGRCGRGRVRGAPASKLASLSAPSDMMQLARRFSARSLSPSRTAFPSACTRAAAQRRAHAAARLMHVAETFVPLIAAKALGLGCGSGKFLRLLGPSLTFRDGNAGQIRGRELAAELHEDDLDRRKRSAQLATEAPQWANGGKRRTIQVGQCIW